LLARTLYVYVRMHTPIIVYLDPYPSIWIPAHACICTGVCEMSMMMPMPMPMRRRPYRYQFESRHTVCTGALDIYLYVDRPSWMGSHRSTAVDICSRKGERE
jgi:hypothetical protein